jgi:hypothetical protein
LKIGGLYFIKKSLYGAGSTYCFKTKNPFIQYRVVSYPVVLSLAAVKAKYPNRWMIPVSPEIVVKHNGRIYKFSELKELYQQ